MIDKNLFLHDLAVVAILKNEGHYLKEWLDYHLLAGVDHFYLYDNDSTDNQAEVAKPYIEAGLVDYISAPGKVMQMPVYNDAVKRFKFQSRYIAFIDSDEFIFPKTGKSILKTVDEILSCDPKAAALGINWQMFGSNGQDKADYSQGVLERFTRRAPTDWTGNTRGNGHVKIISNPRRIYFIHNPHCAIYFDEFYPVNENGKIIKGHVPNAFNIPVTSEKIVINHYYVKSLEEFERKIRRGRCDQPDNNYSMYYFKEFNHNEVFDDGILRYRAARAEKFSLESVEEKFQRVTNALTKILLRYADEEIFDLETALTCRAISNYLNLKIYEEASLAAILKSLNNISAVEANLLIFDLPNLLRLPYPLVEEIRKAVLEIMPLLIDHAKKETDWQYFVGFDYLNDLLKSGGI